MGRVRELVAGRRVDATRVAVLAPRVGLWRSPPSAGSLVRPGDAIGVLEILGQLHVLRAPPGAKGVVVPTGGDPRSRRPVSFGDTLLMLDPTGAIGAEWESDPGAAEGASAVGGLVFVAPMSGRFYLRPSPDKPPLIRPGQTIRVGDSVCLLEVMKTFNRVSYGGAGLPDEARVKRVVPNDGDDINRDDPILELEVD